MAQKSPGNSWGRTVNGEWRVRALADGDEPKIIALFHIVFGSTLTPEQWRWQFPSNPFSRPIVYVAEATDGTLIGHYALIPIPFVKDDQRTLAALSVQSMIHPKFQKRGILKALAAAAEQQLNADGVAVGISFLNDNSLHAYTQYFGWTELQGLNFIYFTVLDSIGVAGKLLRWRWAAKLCAKLINPVMRIAFPTPKRVNGPTTIRAVERFDERVDLLWEKVRRGTCRSVDRNARYLNWRVADKPEQYMRMIAEDGDEFLGIVVAKTERRFGLYFGYIAELLFDPARPDVGRQLTACALDYLREQGCTMATAVTAGSAPILTALRKCGFRRLPKHAMPHGIHFCFKDRMGQESRTDCTWFLSWTDHDVV